MITCNYFNKIGCEILSHDKKAVKSYWIDHGSRWLMQVYCCDECSKIVDEIEVTVGMSIIQNNN